MPRNLNYNNNNSISDYYVLSKLIIADTYFLDIHMYIRTRLGQVYIFPH